MSEGSVPVWFGLSPDRAAVAGGSLPREAVHDWTVSWVEGGVGPLPDVMVSRAMTSLHGFDMAASDPSRPSLLHHGPPGVYYRALAEVQAELDAWRGECAEYDTDPDAWRASRMTLARAAMPEGGVIVFFALPLGGAR